MNGTGTGTGTGTNHPTPVLVVGSGPTGLLLAGDLALARDAYGRLLGAFDLDQEVGTFCGPSSPSDMVTTDVPGCRERAIV